MRTLAVIPALLVASMALGGCSNTPTSAPDLTKCDRNFTLIVPAATSKTIELYELNNGNYSKVVAITFVADDSDPMKLPNPEIRVKEGCTVHLRVQNNNPLEHTFHLHGGLIPWQDDGVDYLTQLPIMPGQSYNYTFPNLKAGTYWYHCHMDGAHHIDLGMYGAFIVEERVPPVHADREYVLMLDEMDNCHVHGNADPINPQTSEQSGAVFEKNACAQRFLQDYLAQNRIATVAAGTASPYTNSTVCPALAPAPGDTPQEATAKSQARAALGCGGAHEHSTPPVQQNPRVWWPETLPVYVPVYNTYLINGHAFPDTPVLAVKQGEMLRLRIINAGNEMHAFHLHGHTLHVAYRDGYPLGTAAFDAEQQPSTLDLGSGPLPSGDELAAELERFLRDQ